MKSVFRVSLSLAMVVMLSAVETNGQQQAARSFSLQDCIDYAMENNPNLKNARAAITSSEAKVGEIIATGLPQINASADLGDNYVIPTSFLPARAFDPSAPEGQLIGVKFGTKYTGRASLNLEQMIFNGSYFVGLKASKTYTELSRKDLISTETDVVGAIKKAYYSVLVSKERAELVDKNYQRLDSLLKQTRAQYESGFAEKIDVNRVQVQFNNILNARNNAAVGLEVSYNLLKFQMGLPVRESISLSDNLESIKFQVLDEGFKNNFQYSNRIEYNILEINHQLVELDIKNTRSQYLPSIDLYGNYGSSYGTGSFDNLISFGANWRAFGTVGLRANMPIFDGLRKSKVVQQKKAQLLQIENSIELTKNQIDLEQQQATLTFQSHVETLRTQRENMELSKEVYDVTVIKYQQGVGSNIEVIDADAAYKEAQTNYFAALYDTLIASVDLEKSYGKLLTK
ncbi:MAG: TolC family protein [Cyclobacteriaceae bacterium]|nr:TolC family protein [Cyclobacteriaceae bacterium]